MGSLEIVAAAGSRRYLLVGELDLGVVDELVERLRPAVAAGEDLRLDLSGLTFIDSTGIRALFRLHEQLGEGILVLERPSEFAQRVMDLVGMGSLPDGPRIEE